MFIRKIGLLFACIMLINLTAVLLAAADIEANKSIARRVYEEILNQGKLEVADEIVDPSFVGKSITGINGLKQMVSELRAAFPDLQYTIEDQVAEGEKVVTRYTVIGTHAAVHLGIPATGASITTTGISIMRLVGGKIVELFRVNDELAFLQQVGLVPSARVDYTWGTPSDVTGDPGTEEANRILAARTLNEIWAQGNLAAADELLIENYVFHDPNMPEVNSREAFKLVVAMYLSAFSDLSFTLEDMIAEGDEVVTLWTGTGTHTGELMGVPATGKQVNMTAISIDRFADGKAVEGWNSSDMLGVMQQLGLIPLLEPAAVEHTSLITSWAAIKKW